MMMTRSLLAALGLAFCFSAALHGPAQAAGEQPVVVELFTSQGCSSCPPADALLDDLSKRPDVVALSLHVDYWDYIGWKDPFGDSAYTQRQRLYQTRLENRFIYTPQMVIDGVYDVVGSRRGQVAQAIEQARERQKVSLTLTEESVTIPAGTAPPGGATVWLALLDEHHETPVAAGENHGRKLVNANVVRSFTKIGEWKGEELVIQLDAAAAMKEGRYACAVLLQEGDYGPILGAAMMEF
jgi:hypothetical protein